MTTKFQGSSHVEVPWKKHKRNTEHLRKDADETQRECIGDMHRRTLMTKEPTPIQKFGNFAIYVEFTWRLPRK